MAPLPTGRDIWVGPMEATASRSISQTSDPLTTLLLHTWTDCGLGQSEGTWGLCMPCLSIPVG